MGDRLSSVPLHPLYHPRHSPTWLRPLGDLRAWVGGGLWVWVGGQRHPWPCPLQNRTSRLDWRVPLCMGSSSLQGPPHLDLGRSGYDPSQSGSSAVLEGAPQFSAGPSTVTASALPTRLFLTSLLYSRVGHTPTSTPLLGWLNSDRYGSTYDYAGGLPRKRAGKVLQVCTHQPCTPTT